ncbi:hypothetical protein CFC21_053615 [Triticum aestivum]|uniref:Uncharacterized protein n=2 Tax=Triticum aestivum TaxID=4565 RepID=A0A3B6I0D4_WHEAT|nr:hypothetical protein CFC21_053615 [Triticum aestivum]
MGSRLLLVLDRALTDEQDYHECAQVQHKGMEADVLLLPWSPPHRRCLSPSSSGPETSCCCVHHVRSSSGHPISSFPMRFCTKERSRTMGKIKAAAKPPPRNRMHKCDTVFSCLFCSHGSSAECRMIVPSSRIFTVSWFILDGYLSIQHCNMPSFFFNDTN